MPAGYVIFNIEVTNPHAYKEYVENVKPIAEQFGGESVSYTHLTLPTNREV